MFEKKKLKDLSLSEMISICRANRKDPYGYCSNCIFKQVFHGNKQFCDEERLKEFYKLLHTIIK